MSARGLSGSRVDAMRAGIMTTKDIRVAVLFFVRRGSVQITRLLGPHDRNAIANRVRQSIAIADQLLRILVVFQRALTERTDQNVKQPSVHAISPEYDRAVVLRSTLSLAPPTSARHSQDLQCERILLHPFR